MGGKPKKPAPKHVEGFRTPPPSTDGDGPAFCFTQTRPGYRIADLDQSMKALLLNRLEALSGFTWREIRNLRHEAGCEPIPRTRMIVPIPSSLRPNDDILSIRVEKHGLFRLIGFRDGRIFRVLWIDPNGNCYPHD
jgi:hypothetical protein